ncbi:4808_t:CDS:2 [Diversispora eburnea]|uniref:4808_t:CDS:1 n=1 Tax=Diversispora eburnea TaxID=1213867 RepID=A0A9N9GLV3_9GLOM|nr:4808_t:CDS:2 [Diversispora eburnea]
MINTYLNYFYELSRALIPSWAFDRKFELGKNVERFPEQSFGLLLGVMGVSVSLTEEIQRIASRWKI